MQIIKDGEILNDRWQSLHDDPIPGEGCILVSFKRWQAEREALLQRDGELGVVLTSEETLQALVPDLNCFQLIALEFPALTDGRGFTFARLLRQRYGYTGELRATGHYLRDQMHFLHRVGVNSFSFEQPLDLDNALAALTEFSAHYQS